jgi:hypothetical protein
MQRIVLALALAAACAGSAYATPVEGTFGLAGDIFLSSSSINWASPQMVAGEAVVTAPTAGSFAGLDGSTVSIDKWSASTEPVGTGTFTPQAFVSFPSATSLPGLLLDNVAPGIYGAGDCALAPAAGQTCSPPGSMLNFANVLTGASFGSSLTFVLQGVTSNGDGTWSGVFTAQFNEPYQDELAALAEGTPIDTSFSAEFTVTSTRNGTVPEPATLSLFAAGLAAAGIAARRRYALRSRSQRAGSPPCSSTSTSAEPITTPST